MISLLSIYHVLFFFFQAEDGIRDYKVTGVQTCALPILLIQLPPSLEFDRPTAGSFFKLLRDLFDGSAVCEPRHPTWFSPAADALLVRHSIGRVAADPSPVPDGDRPGGWPGIVYYRLHGSPRKYWSPYDAAFLDALAASMRQVPDVVPVWCIFDNTASGAALENAWYLTRHLAPR